MKLHWTERRPVVKELNSELNFFWSYEQRMVVVSGNTGSAPLVGSKIIRDRASDVSVWSENGPRIRPTPEPDQSCNQSEADRTPEWSEKAPLEIGFRFCHSIKEANLFLPICRNAEEDRQKRTAVRSDVGAPQVPWPVSAVVQVPRRWTGLALVIRRLSARIGLPHIQYVNVPLSVSLLCSTLRSKTTEGVARDKVFAPSWELHKV